MKKMTVAKLGKQTNLRLHFQEWKEEYGLVNEPNYSPETEVDCVAAHEEAWLFQRSKLVAIITLLKNSDLTKEDVLKEAEFLLNN